jgi:hypothetical protein
MSTVISYSSVAPLESGDWPLTGERANQLLLEIIGYS